MSLQISNISIRDALSQITKTADIVLTPSERVTAPNVEVVSANDSTKLSVTSLRPNGAVISIRAGHNNVPIHEVFRGQVEFIDDMTDPDTFNANIQLSALPPKHPQRTKISMVWNNTRIENTGEDSITAHQILQEACDAVGLPLGRVDLPNYQLVGTYEAFNRSVVDIANDLIGPFNAFDYLRYYVKCDEMNGLQIIAIDYSAADSAIGFAPNLVYELPNVKTIKRTYEMYMPDNRIGDNDILLTGGDRLIPKDDTDTDRDDPNDPGGDRPLTFIFKTTVTQDFWSSSYSDQHTTPEQYTRNLTRVEFDVEMVNFSTSAQTLSDVVSALENSTSLDADLRITASRTIYEASWQYEGGDLTQFREVNYTYTTRTFKGYEQTGNVIHSTFQQIVLTYSEELTKVFVKSEYPLEMVRNYYYFNDFGVQYGTESRKYAYFPGIEIPLPSPVGPANFRGGWFLRTVDWSFSSGLDTINARIRLYLDYLRLLRAGFDAQRDSPFDPTTGTGNPNPGNNLDKQQIVQYQTLNGEPFLPENVLSPKKTDDQDQFIETDIHANYTEEQLRLRKAFQLTCPHMTFAGLDLIYDICLRQVELERLNAYWENTSVTALIDTTVAVGGVVKAEGSVGIVENLSHNISADEATSDLSLRRLIVPSDGGNVIL